MNHQPPDDHRIPDELLIPFVVTLIDRNETDEEAAEDFDDEFDDDEDIVIVAKIDLVNLPAG